MIIWGAFIVLIIIFLSIDLGIFNRTPHVPSTRESITWTSVWVGMAMLFGLAIYWIYDQGMIENPDNLTPQRAALKYITGYLIELSLSVDNIFVIAVIFNSFRIPVKYQHRVLFWGILGAIIFRALMIVFGVVLIRQFSWTTYIFGAFLLFTSVKMLFSNDEERNPRDSRVYKLVKQFVPLTTTIEDQRFFVKRRHITAATPLFVALIIIEFTDILFALDSIPAILAITSDPFLVFSSNILAILGLRSLYFFLSNMLGRFHYLKYSLVAILAFVGVKLILVHYVEFPEWLSLGFIALALLIGVIVSLTAKPVPDNEA